MRALFRAVITEALYKQETTIDDIMLGDGTYSGEKAGVMYCMEIWSPAFYLSTTSAAMKSDSNAAATPVRKLTKGEKKAGQS